MAPRPPPEDIAIRPPDGRYSPCRCELRPAGDENQLPDGDPSMPRDIVRRAEAIPATSMIALAIGAAAFGAIAIGALAIGRLALGRVTVKKARFQALEVDELTVGKLRVREQEGPPRA
jgi:hypothetical protein